MMKLIALILCLVSFQVEASNSWTDPGYKIMEPAPRYGSRKNKEEGDRITRLLQARVDRDMGLARRTRPLYVQCPSSPVILGPRSDFGPEENEHSQLEVAQNQRQVRNVQEDMDALVASIGIAAMIGLIISVLRVIIQNMNH